MVRFIMSFGAMLLLVSSPLMAKDEKAAAAPAKPAADVKNPVVEMVTSEGSIHIELNQDKAPVTVANFLEYVKKGHYDNTVFHRVIDNFMIQGGGFAMDGGKIKEKATATPIKNESKNGLKNERGAIAMARTADPDSATAQFYINVADNSSLDYPNARGSGYAVFGKVVKGLDVVDKIKKTETTRRPMEALVGKNQYVEQPFADVPKKDIVIKSVKVVELAKSE